MAERTVVIFDQRLTYTGLFSVAELYKIIDEFLWTKKWDKRENKNVETVTPEGKYIELDLEPWIKITDYVRLILKIRLYMSDIKEVEVTKDGRKMKLNQGKVQIIFDGYIETDYEHRWEQKPMLFFLRTLFDRYVFKSYMEKYAAKVTEDLNLLHTTIKSFLNLYRY